MSAREDAVQAFVNGGWSEQIAREIVASVCAEARADATRQLQNDITGACLARHEEEQENARLREERHSTNEALSDAAEQLRVQRDRIAELEAERDNFLLPWAHEVDAKTLDNFVGDLIRAAESPLMLVVSEIHETVRNWRELMASHKTEGAVPQQRQQEDRHESELHHTYKLGRDLPIPGPRDGEAL